MCHCARSTSRSSCRSSPTTSSGARVRERQGPPSPSWRPFSSTGVRAVLPQQYPVNLIVEGRPCLVVGGDAIAAEKAAALVACGAEVHVVGEQIGPEVRALPVTWEGRSYSLGELSDYRLGGVATGSPVPHTT